MALDAKVGLDELSTRLRAYARDAREQAAALEPTIAGLAWGADAAGVVRVSLNHDGGIIDVSVDERWRSRLGHRDMGTAVIEAVSAASQAFAAGRIEPAAPVAEATDMTRGPGIEATGHDSLAAGRSPEMATRFLWDLLKDVESSMGHVQAVAASAAADEIEARSASGAVTATSRAGSLVQVVLDQHWLRDATREQVQRELQQALVGALPGQLRHVSAAVRGTGRVAELLDLAGDPMRLMAALGLGGPAQAAGVRHAAA